jgi:hypothetical protein
MSLFKMTAEQRADSDITTRMLTSYFGTIVVAALCLYLLRSSGSELYSLSLYKGSVLLFSALSTIGSTSFIIRLPMRVLVIQTVVSGLLIFGIVALAGLQF